MPTAPPPPAPPRARPSTPPATPASDAPPRARGARLWAWVPPRFRPAAAWTAVAAVVLLLQGWLLPSPPTAVAIVNAVVHVVLFAGLVTLWARAVPRLRAVVLVAAVFVAVGVEAAQVELAHGWVVQFRMLWADFAGILLGGVVDRVYRRRPLPDLPFRTPHPAPPTEEPTPPTTDGP